MSAKDYMLIVPVNVQYYILMIHTRTPPGGPSMWHTPGSAWLVPPHFSPWSLQHHKRTIITQFIVYLIFGTGVALRMCIGTLLIKLIIRRRDTSITSSLILPYIAPWFKRL